MNFGVSFTIIYISGARVLKTIFFSTVGAFVTPTLSSTEAVAFEQIYNQKWLSLYCQGVEAWTEYRRTGYPVLSPAIDGRYDEVPSRYTYPSSESTLNGTNYSAAVANQGADLLTTKLWWNQ